MKLEAAEAKLQELKSNMAILGKEAAAAMAAVEAQQQRLTLQRLIAMVLQFYVLLFNNIPVLSHRKSSLQFILAFHF